MHPLVEITVEELIARLNSLPKDALIYLPDYHHLPDYHPCTSVTVLTDDDKTVVLLDYEYGVS